MFVSSGTVISLVTSYSASRFHLPRLAPLSRAFLHCNLVVPSVGLFPSARSHPTETGTARCPSLPRCYVFTGFEKADGSTFSHHFLRRLRPNPAWLVVGSRVVKRPAAVLSLLTYLDGWLGFAGGKARKIVL